ncbi:hypothetical protein Q3G72_023747 [Acer saccharum]|nr:hypothetical protein Q3G72_023747 [Acer saccharum]
MKGSSTVSFATTTATVRPQPQQFFLEEPKNKATYSSWSAKTLMTKKTFLKRSINVAASAKTGQFGITDQEISFSSMSKESCIDSGRVLRGCWRRKFGGQRTMMVGWQLMGNLKYLSMHPAISSGTSYDYRLSTDQPVEHHLQ